MSDPPERSRRRPPAQRNAGSAVPGALASALFLTPAFVFLNSLFAQAGFDWAVGGEVLLTILAAVVLNAIFVTGETAIELVRGSHCKQAAMEDKKARALKEILENKPLYVATCFLGSQTMRAWIVILCLPYAFSLAPALQRQFSWAAGWPSVLAALFAVAIPAVALNVVLGELVPKSYAVADPAKAACRALPFVRVFGYVFKPVARVSMALGGLVTRRFGASASFSLGNQAEEEIKERLEQAVETQEIEMEEKEMLHSVFEFGDTVAREVMTPRVDMDAVPVDSTLQEISQVVEDSGHSRIPVFEGSEDHIVGVVHAKDVLSALANANSASVRELMRSASFVPQNKNLHDLLREMRASRTQLVVVQDEFGGTAGVVTIEDIVEEVVGEIVDEYDPEEEEVVQNGNSFTIGGKMNIYDVNNEIGTKFESDEFDTFGGFVFGLFGRQPEKGECIEAEGYKFKVEDTDGRRIVSVSLERVDGDSAGVALAKDTAV